MHSCSTPTWINSNVNVGKSWYILVLNAVGFILIVAIILVITVLVSAERFSLVCAMSAIY